jgi:hypothetical protein
LHLKRTLLTLLLMLLAYPLWGQGSYGGPSVLSRGSGGGGRGIGERGGRPPGFSAFAGGLGVYESGFVPASVNSEGQVVELGGIFGMQANLGAYGSKSWRRTTVGLDYSGNYRHYNANSFLNGSDHMLTLGVSNQVSRRVQVFSTSAAGTIARYYTGGNVLDSAAGGVANFGVFDNRAHYVQQNAGVSFAPNSRLTMTGTGNGWTVRRQSRSLVGVTGYGAEGNISYRLNRTRFLEGSYTFQHFDYVRDFGETDVHTAMAGLGQRIGRRWELSLSGGVSKVFTIGLEQVAADPLTAALFGRATSIQAFSRTIYFGAGQAALRGNFKTSNVEFTVSQLPTAGNGVFLTSKQVLMRSSYSYTGIRRASLSLSVLRMDMQSIGQSQLGTFQFVTAGAATSYKLTRSLEAVAQFEARNVSFSQASGFSRFSNRVAIGLNWHPSEFPVTFW